MIVPRTHRRPAGRHASPTVPDPSEHRHASSEPSAATPFIPVGKERHADVQGSQDGKGPTAPDCAQKTSQTLESGPVTHELHPGTDIARNWTVITAAYSGLEQTLKFLIAEKADLTIAELIDLAAPQHAAIDERPVGRHPYRTHDLAWLFSELEHPARDVVQDFYGRFQSLHSYVPIADADEFLTEISGPGRAGYERWRYTLIEDRPLSRNSPETLSAIWGSYSRILVTV